MPLSAAWRSIGTVFALGVLYGLVRKYVRPLRIRWMLLLWAPMALDGFTQLFGWRESTWELRLITGGLFGLSCIWVGFPYLETAFADMRRDLQAHFARIAAPHRLKVWRGVKQHRRGHGSSALNRVISGKKNGGRSQPHRPPWEEGPTSKLAIARENLSS